MDTLNSEEQQVSVKATSGRALSYALFVFVILLPFFFIPSVFITLTSAKALLFFVGVALLSIFWIFSVLKDGVLLLPRAWTYYALALLGFVYLLSSLFSGQIGLSLAGEGFALDTFISVFAGILVVVLLPAVLRSRKELMSIYVSVAVGFFIVTFVQLAHLFMGSGTLGITVLSAPVSNLLGGWNDLGIFSGLIVLLSVLSLEFLSVRMFVRVLLYFLLLLSLFFVALVQFTPVWYILGILSLVLVVYQLSSGSVNVNSRPRRVSPLVLVILLLSLFFIFFGQLVSDPLSRHFNTAQIEIRPSWEATSGVAYSVLTDGSILGVGPNRFSYAWFLHKPDGVNQTAFWSVPFRTGIGFVPTSAVTAGVLGLFAWVLFFISGLYLGARSIFRAGEDAHSRYLVLSSFLAVVYLWIFLVIYNPGVVVFAFSFIFTGVLLSVLHIERRIGQLRFSFSQTPARNFVGALFGIVLLIVVGLGGYVSVAQFVSDFLQQRGIAFASAGDIDSAEGDVVRAINIYEQSRLYRTLTDIQVLRLNLLLQENVSTPEVVRDQFQSVLSTTIANAQRATIFGGDNYQRWMTLGQIYEDLVTLGVEGAYQSAQRAYEEARKHNPKGPDVMLALARLEFRNGNNNGAREFIDKALKLKGNYTDAVFLLSQIEIAEGNVAKAIKSVEAASVLEPNNAAVFFQLGLLRYSIKEYSSAALAFESAISLNKSYANAKYFLGLSYFELGRTQDAIAQFKDVQLLNPDNEEVMFILNNLQSGKEPFSNVAPPLDDTPELRDEPPAEEPVVEEE